jgi:hypothetical protein
MEMEVGSNLLQEIWKGQLEDEKIQQIKRNIKEEKLPSFSEDDEGVLWYNGRICVSNVKEMQLYLVIITLHIILFLHLLSTNQKCTQPCYFPLLYKPTA